MVIARPLDLNVSCKLHLYSLQRTRSPPEPRLPKRIRNTHPRNYYDLRGKDIDLYFLFLSRGIILWIELPWPENSMNTYAGHSETLDSCFDLIRSHQQCIPWSPPLEIEPATTHCSQGNCAANLPGCILQLTPVLFTDDTVTSWATSSQED